MRPKFDPGRLTVTPAAVQACGLQHVMRCLGRHMAGDWGEALCADDLKANDDALVDGDRLLSVYLIDPESGPDAGFLWVITEADRSVTTAQLPSEY